MSKATALLTAVCVVAASPAHAQSLLEVLAGIKFCRTLKDDAQRLKCFDGIGAERPQASPDAGKPEIDVSWQIEDSKSPIDDSPQVYAALIAVNDKSSVLVLRCKERKTEAIFSRRYGFMGSSDPVKMLARINDGKPIETRWSPSTEGTAAFAPSAIQFIRALPDDGKLFLRAFGYRDTFDGEFKLGKVSEARDRIAKACNWPAR